MMLCCMLTVILRLMNNRHTVLFIRHPGESRDLVSHDECNKIPRFRGMTKGVRGDPAFPRDDGFYE